MQIEAIVNGRVIHSHEGAEGVLTNEKWLNLHWTPEWSLVISGRTAYGRNIGWTIVVLKRNYPDTKSWVKAAKENYCRYLAEGYT